MPYIGKSPTGSGVRQRFHFTATGGETSLSGADDNSKTLKFTDGEFLDVYLNGVLLVQGTDYGVGTTNTISSLSALSASDIVEVVVYDIYNVAKINSEAVRARHYYTATGGETSIGTSQIAGLSFAANADIDVSLNGISLVAGTDYNTTTANTVGGLSALTAGQVVEIVIYEKFQLADTVSKASGGTFNGGVTFNSGFNVGTIKDATGTTTAMTIDSSGLTTIKPVVPAFSAYLGTNQAVTSATFTKVQLNSENFDTDNFFDSTTNYRFQPTVAGYYQLNGALYPVSSNSANYIWVMIYKNGTAEVWGTSAGAASAQDGVSQVNALIEMNGSTDYLELYAYITGTSPVISATGANSGKTFMSGFLVRAT